MLRLQPGRGLKYSACRALRASARRKHRRALRRRATNVASANVRVTFRVEHHVSYGEGVAILGSHPALGSWKRNKAVPLKWSEGDVWVVDCVLDTTDNVEYKYVRLDYEGEVQQWSPGDNLVLDNASHTAHGAMTLDEIWGKKGMVRKPSATTKEQAPPPPPPPPANKEPPAPPTTPQAVRERKPVPSLVDEGHHHVMHKEIDIGCPLDAPATIYIVEQNPILSSIVGVNIKLPAFPLAPW